MQFGVQFFPDVKPEQKAGAEYFREALTLAEEAENLGFTHIRIVEHYFHHYGGYKPEPDAFSRRGGPAHAPGPSGNGCRAACLQSSAEARRRDRNARRDQRRASRCRVRPRLSAARVPPFRPRTG